MNSTSEQKTDLPEILQTTLALAESWQNRANTLRTKDELKQQQMMRRLLNHPSDKTVVMHLVDQSFRSGNPSRVVDQFRYLLEHHGIPRFFRKSSSGYSRYFCISESSYRKFPIHKFYVKSAKTRAVQFFRKSQKY